MDVGGTGGPGPDTEVAVYIAGRGPPSVTPAGAAFAREVVALAAPAGRERAKNLLWAAGKLADFAAGLAWTRSRPCCCILR